MSEMTVERQWSALIVPFSFLRPFAECALETDEAVFEPKAMEGERLFEHVAGLVAAARERRPESIGCRWVMKQGGRVTSGLPNRHDAELTCETKRGSWTFAIRSVELLLFETQVGFLVYHISFPEGASADKTAETLYYLKKLSGWDHRIHFERKRSKDESEQCTVHLGALTKRLLEPFGLESFFEGGQEASAGEAVVFSSVLIDSTSQMEEKAVSTLLFRLRRSFKESYKPYRLEQDWAGNPDVLPLFENSVWGASLEGVSNIVTKTGDPVADRFFGSTYFGNIEKTYFPLHILALHQKYALLRLEKRAAGLPALFARVEERPEEQNRLLLDIRTEIAGFLLRSSYKQVSNVTHQADFYAFVRSRLRVDDLFAELHEALDALSSLTEVAEQKRRTAENELRQEKTDRLNRKITGITAVYLPLTVATALFGMNIDGVPAAWWSFLGVTALLYAVTYGMFRLWLNK